MSVKPQGPAANEDAEHTGLWWAWFEEYPEEGSIIVQAPNEDAAKSAGAVELDTEADSIAVAFCDPHKLAKAVSELRAEVRDLRLQAPNGIGLIAAERFRQVNVEGWTPEHDDEHTDHTLARAAVCYASVYPEGFWPWDASWDKRPRGDDGRLLHALDQTIEQRVRCLVKAGALIAAEIDRLQRIEARAAP